MRNTFLKNGDLLNPDGSPKAFGCAFAPVINTNREYARPKLRLKEWDFYQISNDFCTLQVTFGHISYAGAINATLFTHDGHHRFALTIPLIFPCDSLKLPHSEDKFYNIKKYTSGMCAELYVSEEKRTISVTACNKRYGDCHINITLTPPKTDEGILVVTPFEKPNQFYHNYKQCCMPCEGEAVFGDFKTEFNPNDSFGLIDWGRGVLPYTHAWWWGNGSTLVDGNRFGFNIGVFGNNRFATENTLFFNGKAQKLADITYTRGNNYTDDYVFSETDGRFQMTMTPVFDNYTETNLIVAHNRCHQVFGKWNGTVILDNGTTLKIKDMLAFIEEARNRW